MLTLDRTNTGLLGQWWWTIDRWVLGSIVALMALGALLIMASSHAVAERIGLPPFYFINRQVVFFLLGGVVLFGVSLLPPIYIRRMAVLGTLLCLILLCAVLVIGMEVKGAQRWLNVFGLTLQPSELLKPFFIVVTAWMLVQSNKDPEFPGYKIITGVYLLIIGLLALQPDIGMALMISLVWGAQLFLAGLSLQWIGLIGVGGVGALIGAYILFPHVAGRINSFLDPASGDNFQSSKSLEAFSTGGFLGVGPGEGNVKSVLPDSHTDFIFAVAGEELGIIACLGIVAVFFLILTRGFMRLLNETDLFVVYATAGLLIQFGLQVIINIGVALNLLPNTGMTLPFISYGGSSMLSVAITMGMVLALTRRRFGQVEIR